MSGFDLVPDLKFLLSDAPDRFAFEREIRLFQFQTWIYDEEMAQVAGRLAAGALLRSREKDLIKSKPINRRTINSKVLIRLLKDPDYRSLYDGVFERNGWTELVTTITSETFNRQMFERRKVAETVCEMVDFRFRGIDHATLPPKLFNISRSEFYRWHNHPNGSLSWRTIRSRWQTNRSSAPFLYASERLGYNFFPSTFDPARPRKSLAANAPNQARLRKFMKISFYVAEKLDANVLDEYMGIDKILSGRLRPKTKRLDADQLARIEDYSDNRDRMRSS
jgi:hypothetical protein